MDNAEALHRPRISMSLLERKTPPLEDKSFQLTTHACGSDEEIRRHALPGLARVGARRSRGSREHGVPGHRVFGSDPIEASLGSANPRSLAAVTLWTSSRHFLLALLFWMLITSTRVSSFHLHFGNFHVPEATLIIKDPRFTWVQSNELQKARVAEWFSEYQCADFASEWDYSYSEGHCNINVTYGGGEAGIIGYMAEAYDIAIGGTTGIVVPHGLFLNATPLGKPDEQDK
ncbi:hypothetical protein SELMODRAFT_426373 [Selaginella moellendorffii]|uniref:Uncharacterized protein n=1 Tax=Selaginella moellendorffii TaxID=88036 RepID=D8SW64_SELML|nr:hypothetical protein SELMODRAFT_426373 [Selaginella moellendorffii]